MYIKGNFHDNHLFKESSVLFHRNKIYFGFNTDLEINTVRYRFFYRFIFLKKDLLTEF